MQTNFEQKVTKITKECENGKSKTISSRRWSGCPDVGFQFTSRFSVPSLAVAPGSALKLRYLFASVQDVFVSSGAGLAIPVRPSAFRAEDCRRPRLGTEVSLHSLVVQFCFKMKPAPSRCSPKIVSIMASGCARPGLLSKTAACEQVGFDRVKAAAPASRFRSLTSQVLLGRSASRGTQGGATPPFSSSCIAGAKEARIPATQAPCGFCQFCRMKCRQGCAGLCRLTLAPVLRMKCARGSVLRRREDDSGRFGGDVPFYFDATFFQPGQRIACVRRA